jgi:hypothetical protein
MDDTRTPAIAGASAPAAAAPVASVAEHLGSVIDFLSNFRNSVDLPSRQNLIGAMQKVQREAAMRNLKAPCSAPQLADALCGLPSWAMLAAAIGVRELPGFAPYEAGDPKWIESVLNYVHTGSNRFPFPTHQARKLDPVRKLVDAPEIRIAVAGDAGTSLAAAVAVRQQMDAKEPHYTIHLGDVYYSGLDSEEQDFLRTWPRASAGNYTLNSNHEMYCGGLGYFGTLLGDGLFEAQQGLSYFALANEHWLIVGLDSAYFAFCQSLLYEEGAICEPDPAREPHGMAQVEWLRELLPAHAGKRVIVLTHHDGFDLNPATGGVCRKPLYQRMTGEFRAVHDWWWYWGHVHTALAYRRLFFDNNSSMSARCVGHGAIPYEPFPREFSALGDREVRLEWAETDLARNGGDERRAPNGFLLLTLKGAELHEEFYDELGRQRWSNF